MVRLVGGEEVFRSRERVGETKVCDCDSAAERHRRVAHRARVDELDSRYDRGDGGEWRSTALWVPGTDHAGIATQTVVEEVDERKRNHETRFRERSFSRRCSNGKASTAGRFLTS